MISREEAVKHLEDIRGFVFDHKWKESMDMAIGDMQKQIPKKPKEYEDKYYGCPVCGNNLMQKWLIYPEKLMLRSDGLPYCLGCGQAIDWSDNE